MLKYLTLRLSASSIDAYQTCPRLYQITRLQKRPEAPSSAQNIGNLFHAWLETWDFKSTPEWAESPKDYDHAYARGLTLAYIESWGKNDAHRISSEEPFTVEYGDVRISGRLDGVWRLGQRTMVVEHKTTSMDLQLLLRMKSFDRQTALYPLAAKSLGHDVDCVLLDMVRRPVVKKFGSLDELVDIVKDRTECRREELFRTERDVEALFHDLDAVIKLMETGVFPRNPTACYKYGKMCDFHVECANGGTNGFT